MKKAISILTAFLLVLVIVCSCALTVFACARPEKVSLIIEHIESLFYEEKPNSLANENDEPEEAPIPEEAPMLEDVTKPEPQEEQEICTKYIYGHSEMGQPLEAYIINGYGANDKVFFMDFAVHGFEDEFDNDGQVLAELGYSLVEYYAEHPEELGDYRLVIVPCANPDGVLYGVNNLCAGEENAFGRCTYAGIDMNRDFIAGSFKAVESKALKALMDAYMPSIYINFHGWENSVLGNPELIEILVPGLELSRGNPDWYRAEDGFIMGFVKEYYGAKSALVEFESSKNVSAGKLIGAINQVMSNNL